MEPDVIRADPRTRAVTLAVLLVAAAAAIACVLGFQRWLEAHAARVSPQQLIADLRQWIGVAMTAVGLCFLLLGGHAARLARRIGQLRSWPLPGARPLRDTRMLHGDQALRLARWLNAAAILAIVLAAIAAGIGVRLSML